MPTVTIATEPHKRGDTWIGFIKIGPILVNGLPPAASVASCRMQFRTSTGALGYELNSVPAAGKGVITITNAATWEFTIPRQALPLDTGKWAWDFETVDAGGIVDTYYDGTQKIIADISYG